MAENGMPETGSFSTILLAGDRAADLLAEISPCNRKALLSLNGRPMILHVLDTLMSTPSVGSVTVVANRVREISDYSAVCEWCSSSDHRDRVRYTEGAGSPAASVVAALETLPLQGALLVTTADSPLLTAQTLEQFCQATLLLDDADVSVGVATERDIRAAFPYARRTYIRLKGNGYSGCNLFALMSGVGSRAARMWCEVEDRRKHPWHLISYFGLSTLFRALFGQLDLEGAFAAISRSMGLRVKAVILTDPVAAMDVDRPEHIPIAEAVLSKGGTAVAPAHI